MIVPAPLWRRLAAMVYDCFLLIAIALLYSAIHLFIKIQFIGIEAIKKAHAGAAGDIFLFIGVVVCFFVFFYWFWSRNGQTLGMQSWRLRVEQLDGKNINAKQALLRFLIAPLSLACLGAGYLWCLFDKKQCWHDIISGTRVVVLPKK